MSNTESNRVYTLADGGITWLPPKERDEAFMKKYGMTFDEFQKANKPMSDEELKAFLMAHIKK